MVSLGDLEPCRQDLVHKGSVALRLLASLLAAVRLGAGGMAMGGGPMQGPYRCKAQSNCISYIRFMVLLLAED